MCQSLHSIQNHSKGHPRSHLCAVLADALHTFNSCTCVGYQTRAILDAMALDSKSSLKLLKVDGGMTESDICMQIQVSA